MNTTKINIGVALSRNFDKYSLDLLEESIDHDTEQQLKDQINKKLDFLKNIILKQFNDTQTAQQTPKTLQKLPEKATDKQKNFLKDLGYNGSYNLTLQEAKALIQDLLNTPKGEEY